MYQRKHWLWSKVPPRFPALWFCLQIAPLPSAHHALGHTNSETQGKYKVISIGDSRVWNDFFDSLDFLYMYQRLSMFLTFLFSLLFCTSQHPPLSIIL